MQAPAAFYASLVSLPGSQEQQQYEDVPAAGHAAAAASAGAAAAAAAPPPPAAPELCPVRFAAPVLLDPNTGVVSRLPPKQGGDDSASSGSSRGHAAAAAAAAPPQQRQQQQQAQPPPLAASYRRPLDASNVGFRLLRKAGWVEGSGLGRDEQGRADPLQPAAQRGSRGLGFAAGSSSSSSSAPGAPGAAVAKPAPQAGPVLGSKRVAALVAAELAAEDVDAKVRRHRQLLAQEAQQARERAISSYLARAFNEPSTSASGDANPLLSGNHRLSASNPLLD